MSFSKITMVIIFILYIMGAMVGTTLIIFSANNDVSLGLQIDTGMFIAYATYLGAPAATAIGFYSWKSKAENIIKIANSKLDDAVKDNLTATLSNLKGVD